MKNFFAMIYDSWFGVFDIDFNEIYTHLYDNGGYMYFGLILILTPLVLTSSFYFLWKYPYGKLWHWIVLLLINAVFTFGFTYGLANLQIFASSNQILNNLLYDPQSGYQNHAESLPIIYAGINSILSIICTLFGSILMKSFSKIQNHLPF